ncbi:Flp family type IVb pilin [Roseiconus nitratireducens]|uniref:Flp family type IVb pilin n=1 Tax=Roseiconus nitratireducens TaxID=2605748 RepID=A0A5M6D691_9BACT|nr:Flp family type IVb pilin [Roseiconus nitratireducens]KAA5541339.1 Flp family type IVb pilin [Roseiconus nitratireducens]
MKIALKPLYDCIVRDDEGATMAEYGLLVALIAVVCIGGVTLLGTSLNTLFGGVSTSIDNAN